MTTTATPNRKKQVFIALGIMGLVAFVSLMFVQNQLHYYLQRLDALKAEQHNGPENAVAQSTTLTETQHGKKQWMLTADKTDYNAEKNFSNLEGINGELYDAGEQVQFQFIAGQGRYHKSPSRLELQSAVKLVAPKSKVQLSAGNLNWQSGVKMVTAGGGVNLVRPGKAQTQAGAISFTPDFNYVEFIGGVTTTVH